MEFPSGEILLVEYIDNYYTIYIIKIFFYILWYTSVALYITISAFLNILFFNSNLDDRLYDH